MNNINYLAKSLEEIVSSSTNYTQLISRACSAMNQVIKNNNLFTEEHIQAVFEGKANSMLYKSPHNGFVIQLFTWGKNWATPVHDHDGTWGVMGIYRNKLMVKEYFAEHVPSQRQYNIEEIESYTAYEGNVCYFETEPYNTHKVWNPYDEMSISIHVYGKELKEYNIFDLENGKIERTYV
jgi:predicted metal-dependent enzyme (double-stranded beta helix superfamily)